MKFIIIVFSLFLFGCGTVDKVDALYYFQNRATMPKESDSRFTEIIKRFEADMGVKVTLPVVFGYQEPDIGGSCFFNIDGSKWIVINEDVWYDPGFIWEGENIEYYRELIIYHELGHCDLEIKKHIDGDIDFVVNDKVNLKSAKSIMNSDTSNHIPEVYIEHRDYFIKELKSYKK